MSFSLSYVITFQECRSTYRSGRSEGDAAPEGRKCKDEREEGTEPDRSDRRLPSLVDDGEPPRDSSVSSEGIVHPGVGRKGEESGVPNADANQSNEGLSSPRTEDVEEDLEDRLCKRRSDGTLVVLDGEEHPIEAERVGGQHPLHRRSERDITHDTMKKKPKMAEAQTDIRTPMGADRAASRVSSDM